MLTSWSPFEVAMAFDCRRADHHILPIDYVEGVVATDSYGHIARRNTSHEPAMAIPQLFTEPPSLPHDDAPAEDKEGYASFVLSIFYPYDRLLHLLAGQSYWDKFKHWQTTCPRGEKDEFAMHCLRNVQTRQEARAQMKIEADQARIRRRALRAAQSSVTGATDRLSDTVRSVHLSCCSVVCTFD